MDEDATLSRLEEILREERDAIVGLDVAAVERAAAAKHALLGVLRQAVPLAPGVSERLRALRPALQQNLILLAHARDCLRDALAAMRSTRVRVTG